MSRTPLLPFLLGSVALFLAERSLSDMPRFVALGLGAAGILLALGLALRRWLGGVSSERKQAGRRVAIAYVTSVIGIGLYAAGEYLIAPGPSDVRTLLTVAWPTLFLLGLLPALTMELALVGMEGSPKLELFRLSFAARSAAVLVLALVSFAGANFAASKWSKKIDVSYFKMTAPSDVSKSIVATLSGPTRLLLFFPQGNDVLEQVRAYADELALGGTELSIEVLDQAMSPELAKDLKVRANGFLVVKGERASDPLEIGLDLEDARDVLKQLDKEVHERLLEVSRGPRVAYFTTGHNERDTSPAGSDKRFGLSDFKTVLETAGFTVKRLGLGEGLGLKVPDDATMVVVAGPTEPFVPSELTSLHTYVQGGGRLMVMVDPDQGQPLDELLAPYGVKLQKGLLASDKLLVRVEGRGDSPYNFATTRLLSHPSVKTLESSNGRMGVVLLGAGSLERLQPAPAGLKLTSTMRATDAWLDTDGNGRHDGDKEKKGLPDLAIAISTEKPKDAPPDFKEARVIIVADADLAGAGIVRNAGNAYFFLDGAKWLAGDEAVAGEISSEEDVPLVHKKEGDAVWFYGTSFLVPAAVLGFGLVLTRRRGQRS